MRDDNALLTRLQELIEEGESICESTRWDPEIDAIVIDHHAFSAWRARCYVFLDAFLGDNRYTTEIQHALEMRRYESAQTGLSILQALKKDVEAGYLNTLKELVHAEVFGDFLEMADYLLADGYKDPAAMLVGGVLEEHLRQLCAKNQVSIEEDRGYGPRAKKADQMNSDLAKKKVYTGLEQKEVTAWLGLRNKAAHGKYAEYSSDQVAITLLGVRSFLIRHPA